MGLIHHRLSKLMPDGKAVWVPIDHPVSDYPVKGLKNIKAAVKHLSEADALVAHKGVVSKFADTSEAPFIMHISASTRHGGKRSADKVLVGGVAEAISRGALAVSVQVNLGDEYEPDMIERLGMVSEACHDLEVPLLGMIYARGDNLEIMKNDSTNAYAHAARLAFELGCDAVKSVWTGSKESFAKVVKAAPIPVLVAGGPAGDPLDVLEMVEQAMLAGAAGVCMGRQIFSSENPQGMVKALRAIIHDREDAESAKKHLR